MPRIETRQALAATEELGTAARAQQVVDAFLANRTGRTATAYQGDISEFARFLGRPPAVAVAALLAAGEAMAGRLVLEYAVAQRQRGRATATVIRRLATLRALVCRARDAGLVEWLLAVPGEDEITVATNLTIGDDGQYLFPSHPAESDRLDVQHYALQLAFGGNYLAPVDRPRRVLDVGSGTGQWAYELCREFPDALVVGVDRQPAKLGAPPNFQLLRSDLFQGVPLGSDQFDFVHQRLLVPAVPPAQWDPLIAELVRVARPGGWVELVEGDWDVQPAGPATSRLLDLAGRLGAALGLASDASIYRELDSCLARAGLVQVQRRTVTIPLGEWGGRTGSLMATDYRAAATRLCDVYQSRFGMPADECSALVRAAWGEWETMRSRCDFAVAYGRKPPAG